MSEAAIETLALTKRYGRARGVEDLSLRVEQGEVFGFLGPNGAGRRRPSGRCSGCCARPPARPASSATTSTVTVSPRGGTPASCPGTSRSTSGSTGDELIDLVADLRGVRDRGHAHDLAARFGAALDRPLGELSRGNRQKIGLVQALLHRPRVVVMDEPTAGLDPLVQDEFALAVDELREAGTTVFLSSHNLPEVERLCDRIGILRDGRLVAVESVAALAERAVRHIVLRFDEPVDPALFARLPGVTSAREHGSALELSVTGELTDVVRAAAAHRVLDMEARRPPLEDIFATYYGADAAGERR